MALYLRAAVRGECRLELSADICRTTAGFVAEDFALAGLSLLFLSLAGLAAAYFSEA